MSLGTSPVRDVAQPCRNRSSRCPDNCGHPGSLRSFPSVSDGRPTWQVQFQEVQCQDCLLHRLHRHQHLIRHRLLHPHRGAGHHHLVAILLLPHLERDMEAVANHYFHVCDPEDHIFRQHEDLQEVLVWPDFCQDSGRSNCSMSSIWLSAFALETKVAICWGRGFTCDFSRGSLVTSREEAHL